LGHMFGDYPINELCGHLDPLTNETRQSHLATRSVSEIAPQRCETSKGLRLLRKRTVAMALPTIGHPLWQADCILIATGVEPTQLAFGAVVFYF